MKDGKPKAFFYLDPYSRPAEKRGGAWMAEVVGRSKLLAPTSSADGVRLPVAHMVCNQSPPVGDKPSLMTFREVETLFHEAGHALQHSKCRRDQGKGRQVRYEYGLSSCDTFWFTMQPLRQARLVHRVCSCVLRTAWICSQLLTLYQQLRPDCVQC